MMEGDNTHGKRGLEETVGNRTKKMKRMRQVYFVDLDGTSKMEGGAGIGHSEFPFSLDVDIKVALEYLHDHAHGVARFIKAEDEGGSNIRVTFEGTVSDTDHGTVSYVKIGAYHFVVKTRFYDDDAEYKLALDRMQKLDVITISGSNSVRRPVSYRIGLSKFYFKAGENLTVTVMERAFDLFDRLVKLRDSGGAPDGYFKGELVKFLKKVVGAMERTGVSFTDLKAENIVVNPKNMQFRLIDIDAIDAFEVTDRTLAVPRKDFDKMIGLLEPESLQQFMMIITKFAAMAVAGLVVDEYETVYTKYLMYLDGTGKTSISSEARLQVLRNVLRSDSYTKAIEAAYGEEVKTYFDKLKTSGFYDYSVIR